MSIIQYLKEELNPTYELDMLLKENEETVALDSKFITRLINYIDGVFPSYGDLDSNINNELRKVMKVGDGTDVKKVKKKIHNILMKCKAKLLHTLKDKAEKIQVEPKNNESGVPELQESSELKEYKVDDIIVSSPLIDRITGEKYVLFSTKDGKYKTKEPDHILKKDKNNNDYYQLGYSYWYDGNLKLGRHAYDYIFPIARDKERSVKILNNLINKKDS